jgi:hypothetical protein
VALMNFLKNLDVNNHYYGRSNAGCFNVETGEASFRTAWVGQCDCDISSVGALQYDCKKCGKTKTNNLSIPSGDGDGVYAVVSYLNQKGEVFACTVTFDSNSNLANQFIEKIKSTEIRDFDASPIIFQQDYQGVEIGKLELGDANIVYISDASAGLDSSMATLWIDNWISGGITAFAFVESSLESKTAQMAISMGTSPESFNGGFEESFRPRVIILISDAYRNMSEELTEFQLSEEFLSSQIKAWSKQSVFANVGQQSSAVMYWNGRLENVFATHALDNNLGNEMDYAFKEFSWYLQGAHFDDANCAQYAKEMIDESGGELTEVDLLRDAYLFRGLVTKAESLE